MLYLEVQNELEIHIPPVQHVFKNLPQGCVDSNGVAQCADTDNILCQVHLLQNYTFAKCSDCVRTVQIS